MQFRLARWAHLALLVPATLSLGCSDDSGNQCGFSVCGGDPTGNWYQESVCQERGFGHLKDSIVSDPECWKQVNLVSVDSSVTLNLDSVKTFTRTATTMLHWEMVWDAECLGVALHALVPPAAVPEACADYNKRIMTDTSLPFTSGVCEISVDGTACVCHAQYYHSVGTRGSYGALNGYLNLSDGSRLGYCVRGSKMSVRDPDGPFGPVVENLQLRPLS